jgi:hypothetical protein
MDRIAAALQAVEERSAGGSPVTLLAHSAGGWLSRVFLLEVRGDCCAVPCFHHCTTLLVTADTMHGKLLPRRSWRHACGGTLGQEHMSKWCLAHMSVAAGDRTGVVQEV